MSDSVRAMRLRRRSGLLRTQPLRVFALREPPAIAIGAAAMPALHGPTGEAGAPNLSTYFGIALRCAVMAVCTLYAISLWVVR